MDGEDSALKILFCVILRLTFFVEAWTQGTETLPKASIDGIGSGWSELKEKDFANVNCERDKWSWKNGVFWASLRQFPEFLPLNQ